MTKVARMIEALSKLQFTMVSEVTMVTKKTNVN